MKRSTFSLFKLSMLGVPLLLALIGFLNALFNGVCLYALNYQDIPPNFWVEAARWAAPLATASGVLIAVSSFRERLHAYFCYHRGNSVAVYGPESEKNDLPALLEAAKPVYAVCRA